MIWYPVYTNDTRETVVISGWECSECGYISAYRHIVCPHCKAILNGAEDITTVNLDEEDDNYEQ